MFRKLLVALLLLLIVDIAYSQERIVQGLITDESNAPILGANIVIKGTINGTVSDTDGKFLIKVPSENTVISVSFVGFEKQEVKVGNSPIINIVLKEIRAELESLVVVGYGIQKKSDLTGSIGSVSSKQLEKTPSSGVVQALQGKVAGVQIINNSGMPGAGITVRVRGINSITTVNGSVGGPLYIIDGIPGDINSINPNDIEHLEVLKDASSQAIYGSSGGNGVILVSTKKGKKGQKAKVDFSMYRGIQSNDINVEMCNTKEWIQMYNSLPANFKKPITDNPDSLPNTNWWNEISHNAIMEEYNLTTTAGTENSTTLFSLGYLNQDGVVNKTDYKRYTIRVNTSVDVSKRVKIGQNFNLAATRQRGLYDNSSWGSVVAGALTTSPIGYVRDTTLSPALAAKRNIGWGGWGSPYYGAGVGNPAVGIYYDNRQTGTYRASGNMFANIELLKGLSYNQNFGFDVNFYETDNYKPYYNVAVIQQNLIPTVERGLDRNFSWNWQHVVNYKTQIDQHKFDIMAGFEASEYSGKTLFGKADSLIKDGATPEFQVIDATLRSKGSDYYLARGTAWRGSHYGYFGRVNYEFNNLFLAQFSYRYDGSTKFGPKHRYGSFPALSTGFKFSELDVVKNNLTFLDFGKVRFGWGITGNDNIDAAKFYSLVDQQPRYGYVFGGEVVPGGVALAPGNPELHWETITTFNYGLDLSLLNNKLSITADYFNKNTSGMLQNVELPLVAGRYVLPGSDGKYAEHVGGLLNRGIELMTTYKDNVGELKYSVDFNFTKINSKLHNMRDTLYTGNEQISISRNGDAPGLFWGFKTDGLFRPSDADSILDPGAKKARYVVVNQPYKINSKGGKTFLQNNALPGDLRFLDMNGDTIISSEDKTIIGNPNPKFTYGFSVNLEYKGFDLNCFFQGSYGNDIYMAIKSQWYGTTASGNWVKDALNAYRDPIFDATGAIIDPGNTTTDQFRLVGKDNYKPSDWYVEDGSYLRLKSLQIAYTVPLALTQKIGIGKLRVYAGGRNLLTFTKYSGTDPEIGGGNPTAFGIDYGVYPQSKMYNVGVNVTF